MTVATRKEEPDWDTDVIRLLRDLQSCHLCFTRISLLQYSGLPGGSTHSGSGSRSGSEGGSGAGAMAAPGDQAMRWLADEQVGADAGGGGGDLMLVQVTRHGERQAVNLVLVFLNGKPVSRGTLSKS